jgi:ABC-type phosphate transport system substrate-binding protein
MLRRFSLLPSLGLALAVATSPAVARAQGYVVIVNTANPVASVSRSDLSKIFLKKVERWPNGQPAAPVDLGASSPAREKFTTDVIGKSPRALEAYWQQQIFSGKNVPPVSKPTDDEVIEFVKANPNAVGYVSPKAAEGAGVKRLTVTD